MYRLASIIHIILCILNTIPGEISVVAAGYINITVDDSYSDPFTKNSIIYTGDWHVGQDCPGCFAQPDDRSQVYNNSWHDSTRKIEEDSVDVATFNFTGAFCTLPGQRRSTFIEI